MVPRQKSPKDYVRNPYETFPDRILPELPLKWLPCDTPEGIHQRVIVALQLARVHCLFGLNDWCPSNAGVRLALIVAARLHELFLNQSTRAAWLDFQVLHQYESDRVTWEGKRYPSFHRAAAERTYNNGFRRFYDIATGAPMLEQGPEEIEAQIESLAALVESNWDREAKWREEMTLVPRTFDLDSDWQQLAESCEGEFHQWEKTNKRKAVAINGSSAVPGEAERETAAERAPNGESNSQNKVDRPTMDDRRWEFAKQYRERPEPISWRTIWDLWVKETRDRIECKPFQSSANRGKKRAERRSK